MQTPPNQSPARRKNRIVKWLAAVAGFICLLAVIYIFAVPSGFELAIGEKLPNSAKVVHTDYDFAPLDQVHRFAISFTDDQARDLFIKKWNLQTDPSNIMGAGNGHSPSWWPSAQLQQIEQSGECYGRVNKQTETWWTIWIDRTTNLLYLEVGNW